MSTRNIPPILYPSVDFDDLNAVQYSNTLVKSDLVTNSTNVPEQVVVVGMYEPRADNVPTQEEINVAAAVYDASSSRSK